MDQDASVIDEKRRLIRCHRSQAKSEDIVERIVEYNRFQGIAAYHYRFKSPTSYLYALEPAFRFDLSDPNTDLDGDRSTLITAVLGVYFSSRSQFRVAYERQSFQGANVPSISGVRSALTVNF